MPFSFNPFCNMEFPPEILRIIRAFSRPYFIHFREYNWALRVHGKKEWPELKRAMNKSVVIDCVANVSLYHGLFMESVSKFENGIDEYDILDKQCKLHRAKEVLLSILQ